MDLQFGDDGAFYLLTYGDGFFNINPDAGMYKWEYAKGQRAPRAVLTPTAPTARSPLTVRFSSAGTVDPDPGDSIVLRVGLRRRHTVSTRSTRRTPTRSAGATRPC